VLAGSMLTPLLGARPQAAEGGERRCRVKSEGETVERVADTYAILR
jgi:hypothetical protein